MKIVFWGTGSGGVNLYNFCKLIGIAPDYFCTNDSTLWNHKFCNTPVISPSNLETLSIDIIYISSYAVAAIRSQIDSLKLDNTKIIDATFCYTTDFYKNNKDKFNLLFEKCKIAINKKRKHGCYIDLSDGPAYSGISDWSIQFHCQLLMNRIPSKFVIRDFDKGNGNPYFSDNSDVEFLDDTVDILLPYRTILEGNYDTVVCNNTQNFFLAACYAKRKLKKIKLVLIIHNLLPIYFSNAVEFKEDIDECYVISDYIRDKLVALGFPCSKLRHLQWGIRFQKLTRTFSLSGPIRIGFAGRVVKEQKRIDLVVKVLHQLFLNKVDFIFSLAGQGKDYQFFLDEIKKYNLEKNIRLVGIIKKEDILVFWQSQDIFLSCSDYEGHSISQVEAICSGAVPVVTDVSGARDDIVDGDNGFILPVGDFMGIASCVKNLYEDRSLLRRMSDACIKQRNKFNIKFIEKTYIDIMTHD